MASDWKMQKKFWYPEREFYVKSFDNLCLFLVEVEYREEKLTHLKQIWSLNTMIVKNFMSLKKMRTD